MTEDATVSLKESRWLRAIQGQQKVKTGVAVDYRRLSMDTNVSEGISVTT